MVKTGLQMDGTARFIINDKTCGQLVTALFGLILLLFPFVGINSLAILTFLILISLKLLPDSSIFCRPFDSKISSVNGQNSFKIKSIQNIALSAFILLLIRSLLQFTSYSYPLYVIGCAVAIATFGNSAAAMVRGFENSNSNPLESKEELHEDIKNKKGKQRFISLKSSAALLAVGIVSAFLGGSWIVYWQGDTVSYNMVFFIAVIGAITGALFESIPSRIDNNISVPLASGMAMWMFSDFGYYVPPTQLTVAFMFSILLGYLAYKAKIADVSALFSATILGVLTIVFGNIYWFVLLLTFFILGGGFTKYKYQYKESLGLAQSKDGVRSYENVFSNSMAALILAVAFGIFPQHGTLILYAYLGTVATATGDTLASEIGTTSRSKPRMITNFKVAKPGVDGAVTPLGELSALFGGIVIGVLAALFGMVDNIPLAIFIAAIGGFLGTNVDSYLGATLQNRGMLSNSGVNFFATFAGALISGALYLLLI